MGHHIQIQYSVPIFKIKDADELYNFVGISFADFKHPLEPELKLAAVLD